jgi:acetate---CoA ligase (ADP-forming)
VDLGKILKPKNMAVIGVSLTNEAHPANVVYYKNQFHYDVQVFAVNGRGGTLRGEPVYRSILEVPGNVDLAVIATRAGYVPDVMKECIDAGVGGAVVISGGFAETGMGDLQERLRAMAREAEFPFIGPNCLGIYAPPYTDTFFIPTERMVRPEKGKVAIVSQSGGVLVDHMVKCFAEGVKVSLAVSIGNKALIGEIDLLRYLQADPETGVIAFYIEGFGKREGREFAIAASACPKPVIVVKAGKSSRGRRAVSSHTASLAGDYKVFSSVMKQYGIVEARDEVELVSFAEALSSYQKPIIGNIAVITGSGGHGALATDSCSAHDLAVPVLDEKDALELKDRVSPAIREIASFGNPIDLTGSSIDDDFVAVAKYLSTKEAIDCVIVLLLPYLPGVSMDLGARLGLVYQQEKKPIIAYVPHVEKYSMLMEGFMLSGIPVAHSVEDAVHMADAIRRNRAC